MRPDPRAPPRARRAAARGRRHSPRCGRRRPPLRHRRRLSCCSRRPPLSMGMFLGALSECEGRARGACRKVPRAGAAVARPSWRNAGRSLVAADHASGRAEAPRALATGRGPHNGSPGMRALAYRINPMHAHPALLGPDTHHSLVHCSAASIDCQMGYAAVRLSGTASMGPRGAFQPPAFCACARRGRAGRRARWAGP